MHFKNITELVNHMADRPDTWTAIEAWDSDGITPNGLSSNSAHYAGNGAVFYGAETKAETRRNLQQAVISRIYGPYWNCPDCVRNEWTVKASRLRELFNSEEKEKSHPFCDKSSPVPI